jgi:flavin-dependent dehydrogenase
LLAAEIIHKGLSNNDCSLTTLGAYDEQLTKHIKKNMRRSYFIQRSLMIFPLWVDFVVRWGGSNSKLAQTFISKL